MSTWSDFNLSVMVNWKRSMLATYIGLTGNIKMLYSTVIQQNNYFRVCANGCNSFQYYLLMHHHYCYLSSAIMFTKFRGLLTLFLEIAIGYLVSSVHGVETAFCRMKWWCEPKLMSTTSLVSYVWCVVNPCRRVNSLCSGVANSSAAQTSKRRCSSCNSPVPQVGARSVFLFTKHIFYHHFIFKTKTFLFQHFLLSIYCALKERASIAKAVWTLFYPSTTLLVLFC